MQIKGSDVLDYTEAMKVGENLISTRENPIFGFFVICGANFGLRVSDLLKITHEDIESGVFIIQEQKTKKKRKLTVNEAVSKYYNMLISDCLAKPQGYVFKSQKGTVYSPQHINRLLKQHFHQEGRVISSHSLRKGFGRRVYERSGQDLGRLQLLLNHSSPDITLAYIGVTQETLDNTYGLII